MVIVILFLAACLWFILVYVYFWSPIFRERRSLKDRDELIAQIRTRGKPTLRRVMVILNGVSGDGAAKSFYDKLLLPVLRAANVHVIMVPTTGTKLMLPSEWATVDAIAILGGDGSVHVRCCSKNNL
jgi:hypothetical protein